MKTYACDTSDGRTVTVQARDAFHALRLAENETGFYCRNPRRVSGRMSMARYVVVQYRRGKFDAVMSGMGKNRGTWDADHSRSAAYRHAAELRAEPWRAAAGLSYRVEPGP